MNGKLHKCNTKDIVSFFEGNEVGALSPYFASIEGENLRDAFIISLRKPLDGVDGPTDFKEVTDDGGRSKTFQEPMEKDQKSGSWNTAYVRGKGRRSSSSTNLSSKTRLRKTSATSGGSSQSNKRSAGSTEDMDVDKEAIAKGKKPKNIQVSKQLKSPNQSKKL